MLCATAPEVGKARQRRGLRRAAVQTYMGNASSALRFPGDGKEIGEGPETQPLRDSAQTAYFATFSSHSDWAAPLARI